MLRIAVAGYSAETVVAYIHHASIMLCFASLTLERILIKTNLSKSEILLIIATDIIYGISALFLLMSGILRVLYFGEKSSFYTENPLFWWKVGIYLAIEGLSLYPTITYILWIMPLRQGNLPRVSQRLVQRLYLILNVEIIIFITIPFLATLITHGIRL